MTQEQLSKIERAIDKLDHKIDAINTRLDNYIESDNQWKQAAQPTIEMGNNVRGFGKVFMYILGIVAAIGAAIKGLELLMRK